MYVLWCQSNCFLIQIAIDLDNNRLFYGKNGTWLNSGDPTSSTGAITIGAVSTCPEGAYFFAHNDDTGTTAPSKFEFNFFKELWILCVWVSILFDINSKLFSFVFPSTTRIFFTTKQFLIFYFHKYTQSCQLVMEILFYQILL